jgi:acetyl esterase/lipase
MKIVAAGGRMSRRVATAATRAGFVVAALALAAAVRAAEPAPPRPAPTQVTIATVQDAGKPFALRANVHLPASGDAPAPLVLFLHGHGGAFDFANGAPSYEHALTLPARGIAVATISYRPHDPLPGEIFDVKGYVRWFRANAKRFNIDPQRIGVWGASRGGHLAALLATTGGVAALEGDVGGNLKQSSRVQCAAIFYPLTDLLTSGTELMQRFPGRVKAEDELGLVTQLVGYSGPGGIAAVRAAAAKNDRASPAWPAAERARLANPIAHVTSDDAPIFVAHGADDTAVAVEQSTRLYDRYVAAGLDAKLAVWSKGTHGNVGVDIERAAVEWFVARLLAPAAPRR